MAGKSSLLPEDRNFLVGILGADTVAKLETDADARGKILESAGIKFKSVEDGPDEASSDTVLMIAATAKLFEGVNEAVKSAAEVTKQAVTALNTNDTRLGEIESKLERQNIMLMAILAPQAASKSIFTVLNDEEKKQLEALQKTDEAQKPATRTKSLLEQMAEAAGANPIP